MFSHSHTQELPVYGQLCILSVNPTRSGPPTCDPGGVGVVIVEKMRCTTLSALLLGVVLYLVMGALVFQTLEYSEENEKFQKLLAAKNTFLRNHSCVSEMEFRKLVKVSHPDMSE